MHFYVHYVYNVYSISCSLELSVWYKYIMSFRFIFGVIHMYSLFSAANSSKFCQPFCQILLLTAVNFPHISFLRSPKPELICSICHR